MVSLKRSHFSTYHCVFFPTVVQILVGRLDSCFLTHIKNIHMRQIVLARLLRKKSPSMSQRDVMGFQTISNFLFFDFEGNMSNVDVEISWKLSFIPLNSGGLYDISKPNISLIYILTLSFVFYSFINGFHCLSFVSVS